MKHKLEQKEEVHFEHNFTSVTVLCYLKESKEKLQITPATQSHNLYNCVLIFIMQMMMLVCMLYTIANGEDETSAYTKRYFAPNFSVLLVKFPSALALHLLLHPEVTQGMVIMKFANN